MATKRTAKKKNHATAAIEKGRLLDDALDRFPRGVGSLTGGERFDVLDNWVQVLDGLYAHLPLKLALYGFSPVRAIERLRQEASNLNDLQFHRELMAIINRLRDAHTQYTGPKTLHSAVATLPFLVEEFGPITRPNYIVTKVNRRIVRDSHFIPGVKLEYWNGIPFDRAVDLHAEVETGGRPDARRARALESLTFRALGYLPPPDERWVIVQYCDAKGKQREVRFDWRVVYPDRDPRASKTLAARMRRAINPAAEAVRRAKKLMFNPELWRAERNTGAATTSGFSMRTGYEDFLTARTVADGKYGYLRIWSFDVDDDQGFLEAAIKLLRGLPDRGLIIDLRDNPGGLIWAAERMLQLFTPNPITPTKFALRATPLTAAMAQAPINQQELGPWAASLEAAAGAGEPYSSHLPITSVGQCNDLGQYYGGPVVVVVDANTYSSGDLFTAGVEDNRIGPVVCIGEATGAGGANVWESDDVRSAMESAGVRLPPMPHQTSFTLAVRRAVRSGDADGTLIEDSGVPGLPYAMTRHDVLDGNRDLIAHCGELLVQQPWTRMHVSIARHLLAIDTVGLDRLDIYADGHPACASVTISDGLQKIATPNDAKQIEVVGFGDGSVRQRRLLSSLEQGDWR
jgi:hypothetical protein